MRYNAHDIEEKWQKIWGQKHLYGVDLKSKKPKFYCLVMFPYPSGDKLHIGHWYNFAPVDSYARYMRMRGYNVFEPMGYDAFGLPAENYAIKTGVSPKESTEKNIAYMRQQLVRIGAMYDWSKEVNTSHPNYYRWTQWVFLKLYEKGLAYKKNAPVNFCPSCQTVLANEQVQEGLCERCDTEVIQKNLSQWFFKITQYAEDLLNHQGLDWPEKTLLMQQHWIGKSEGAVFPATIKDLNIPIETYNSVPQMAYADTFYVIAPEHPLVEKLVKGTHYEKSVMEFVEQVKKKKRENRFIIEKESEGIFTGRYVEDLLGNGDLPIWVASYVIAEYGTGIVKCSAHDERDFAFAKKYKIPLKVVLVPNDEAERKKVKNFEYCYRADDGFLTEPLELAGKTFEESRELILDFLEKKKLAKRTTSYHLRDWLISRQRYWGAPIPMINCPNCGAVPVPAKDLPVLLPEEGVDYLPKGKPPLASSPDFMNTVCPQCGGKAQREPETMDTFVDSSWYFLRYLSSHNDKRPFDEGMNKKWMPVDMYVGGPEHACMHLLYARFIHKVLMDDRRSEPFKRLVHQGLITKDGAKMSKSKGNVVSPDEFVEKYGSDVFRMYMMFMGPFTEGGDWNDRGITGIARFVQRVWNLMEMPHAKKDSDTLLYHLHTMMKKVTEDIEIFHFNTAISAMMEFTNVALKEGISLESKKLFDQILAPFAPHLAEEAWKYLGEKFSIFNTPWPKFNKKYLKVNTFELVIQINGKVRARVIAKVGISQKEALEFALVQPNIVAFLKGKKHLKEIFVPGKLLNIVVVSV